MGACSRLIDLYRWRYTAGLQAVYAFLGMSPICEWTTRRRPPTIYAISDIHGCLDEFEEALAGVDLSEVGSRLVLLGEYCDRG